MKPTNTIKKDLKEYYSPDEFMMVYSRQGLKANGFTQRLTLQGHKIRTHSFSPQHKGDKQLVVWWYA